MIASPLRRSPLRVCGREALLLKGTGFLALEVGGMFKGKDEVLQVAARAPGPTRAWPDRPAPIQGVACR